MCQHDMELSFTQGTIVLAGWLYSSSKKESRMISLIREREEPYFKNKVAGKTILVVAPTFNNRGNKERIISRAIALGFSRENHVFLKMNVCIF